MKILVLGATGRTGHLFTRKALEEGHAVTAYVRNPDKALALLGAHQNLTVIPGTLDDAERLAAAASGQDVMVSILGAESHGAGISLLHVHAGASTPHHGGGHGRRREALRSDERLRRGRYGTDRLTPHAPGVQGHHARHFHRQG